MCVSLLASQARLAPEMRLLGWAGRVSSLLCVWANKVCTHTWICMRVTFPLTVIVYILSHCFSTYIYRSVYIYVESWSFQKSGNFMVPCCYIQGSQSILSPSFLFLWAIPHPPTPWSHFSCEWSPLLCWWTSPAEANMGRTLITFQERLLRSRKPLTAEKRELVQVNIRRVYI